MKGANERSAAVPINWLGRRWSLCFFFVMQSTKLFTTTNLTSKVRLSRLAQENEKMVDLKHGVKVSLSYC